MSNEAFQQTALQPAGLVRSVTSTIGAIIYSPLKHIGRAKAAEPCLTNKNDIKGSASVQKSDAACLPTIKRTLRSIQDASPASASIDLTVRIDCFGSNDCH